jgi:hypothetical protein
VKELNHVGGCAFRDKSVDVVRESVIVLRSLDEFVDRGLILVEVQSPEASGRFTVAIHDLLAFACDFDVVLSEEDFTAIVTQNRDGDDVLFDCLQFVPNFGRWREATFDDITFCM